MGLKFPSLSTRSKSDLDLCLFNDNKFVCFRIKDIGLRKDQYEWYLDLCKQGTVIHSGFSVMFDVMVLFATGLSDVRDVVPFPRQHGKLDN